MSLFEAQPAVSNEPGRRPLADRMRPETLEEFVGQVHILGPGKPLRQQIERDELSSMILWGPPGSGKTTLAMIVARKTRSDFIRFSAVLSGIKEIKEVMAEAEKARHFGRRTILFVDEIHRFNKAQQDAFLPYVERGDIILIGATTENPSFEVNAALLSRTKVYMLSALSTDEIVTLLRRALQDEKRGLGGQKVVISDELLRQIAVFSNGDARTAYNTLETAVAAAPRDAQGNAVINEKLIEDAIQRKVLLYDKAGEEHFNLISALHKSVRNSDADAALYWLGRMLEAGEDPLYIARRLIRMASEDVGLADPKALEVAVAAMQAVHFVGLPEGDLALAQAAVYLALAPKSNALYVGYGEVKADAQKTVAEPVPLHLRNPVTSMMADFGYGKGYQYAHDTEEKLTDMECLPGNLRGRRYYHPTDEGFEKRLKEKMAAIEEWKRKRTKASDP
ncbi:MAG TPA: replication-associated recombination protein A [Terriglobia bacterium]|jgi:putative ATPase|nr:replication-associated recombination protein A [Terriglobia bacterium]